MPHLNILPDADYLRQLLIYNENTGVLIWRPRSVEAFKDGGKTAQHSCNAWNSKFANKPAGCVGAGGYVFIRFDDVLYRAHRIAWKMVYGLDAPADIDHIDGDRTNNKLSNLRLATRTQNCGNRDLSVKNRSGFKGVSWYSKDKKWVAELTYEKKRVFRKYFNDPEEASKAYQEAAEKYYGEYAFTKRTVKGN